MSRPVWLRVGGVLGLAGLALLAIPPFLAMELHSDAILFDLYARNLSRGGVAYRDWCETNLPGMAWAHVVVRAVAGWEPMAMRIADLAVITTAVCLLVSAIPHASRSMKAALAAALLLFYVTQTEWCHVQRDPWMLLPALAAITVRLRMKPLFHWAFLEGMLWASAFWIKPHVAVPGIAVWCASAVWMHYREDVSWRGVFKNGVGVLGGGILVGAMGTAWLVGTGAWPHFWEMATVWNPEYFSYDVTQGQRWPMTAGLLLRFTPWLAIHVVSAPLAIVEVWRREERGRLLLAAIYLGWLLQSVLFQHLFDYVHLPGVLLGFAVVADRVTVESRTWVKPAWIAWLAFASVSQAPVVLGDRLAAWPRVWFEPNHPEVRDLVSGFHRVAWVELRPVVEYLRSRSIENGELTCYNMPPAALYRELDVEPATRYHFFQNNYLTFRGQRLRIARDLEASRQRFLICDLMYHRIDLPRPDVSLLFGAWDKWKPRIVHQSGRYIVLELSGQEAVAWLGDLHDLPIAD